MHTENTDTDVINIIYLLYEKISLATYYSLYYDVYYLCNIITETVPIVLLISNRIHNCRLYILKSGLLNPHLIDFVGDNIALMKCYILFLIVRKNTFF